MKNNATLLFSFILVVGDFLAIVSAFALAYVIRFRLVDPEKIPLLPGQTFIYALLAVLPIWIIIHAFIGLYRQEVYEKRLREIGRLFIGAFLGILALISYDYMSDDPLLPGRLVPLYGVVLAFILLVLFRQFARLLRRLMFSVGRGISSILIVGNTPVSDELLMALQDSKKSGYNLLGVVGDKRRAHHADFTDFKDAIEAINDQDWHGIIQTELYADDQRNREILDYAQTHHLSYRFVPGNTELFVGNIQVDLFHSIPVIAVHQTPLLGWGRIAKRIFDIVVSAIMLVVLSPLMLLVALAVKANDPKGPVFMRGKQQGRLTRHDRIFKVYKFRSHYAQFDGKTDEEVFAMIGKPELIKEYRKNGDKLPNDFRVTPVGKFTRKTSLDELPQLINVLKGDISLVGPRALVPQELTAYEKKHTILSVKSGLTGLAVVSGRRNLSFEDRRKLDLYYVQNWSFWLDIAILFRTLGVLLNKEEPSAESVNSKK